MERQHAAASTTLVIKVLTFTGDLWNPENPTPVIRHVYYSVDVNPNMMFGSADNPGNILLEYTDRDLPDSGE